MTGHPGQATRRPTPGKRTRKTDTAARDLEATRLRLTGLTYAEIATRLGYADKSGAQRAVTRCMEETKRETAQEVLGLELDRLDALQAALWAAATSGDIPAINTLLKIMERRARYLNLDGSGVPVSMQDRVSRMTRPETIERMAELYVDVARDLFLTIREHAEQPRTSNVTPRWIAVAQEALRNASLEALTAEFTDPEE